MGQRLLNTVMLLHMHKGMTDQLLLLEVSNKFVNTEHRMTVFGAFSESFPIIIVVTGKCYE